MSAENLKLFFGKTAPDSVVGLFQQSGRICRMARNLILILYIFSSCPAEDPNRDDQDALSGSFFNSPGRL
jgi:hypothetical protein